MSVKTPEIRLPTATDDGAFRLVSPAPLEAGTRRGRRVYSPKNSYLRKCRRDAEGTGGRTPDLAVFHAMKTAVGTRVKPSARLGSPASQCKSRMRRPDPESNPGALSCFGRNVFSGLNDVPLAMLSDTSSTQDESPGTPRRIEDSRLPRPGQQPENQPGKCRH